MASWSSGFEAAPRGRQGLDVVRRRAEVGQRLALAERRLLRARRTPAAASASATSGSARKRLHLARAGSGSCACTRAPTPRRRPRLGARRLVVEVHVAVVARPVPAPSRRRPVQNAPRRLPAPKRRSWSKRGPCWPLRSMWNSLPCHSACAMPCAKFSPAISSCPTSGLRPTISGCVELADERDRVADRRQQDVAARLVRLRLEREPDVVALLARRSRRAVFSASRYRSSAAGDVLAAAGLGALAAAPQSRTSSRPARRRGRCCAAPWPARSGGPSRSLAVSAPSLNTGWVNRLVVTISTTQPGVGQRLARTSVERRLAAVASSGTRSSSWKVTAAAPSSASLYVASTGSSGGRDCAAEDVDALPADGPQAEGELVLGRGGVVSRGHRWAISCQVRVSAAGLDRGQHPLDLQPVGERRRRGRRPRRSRSPGRRPGG